MRRRPREIQLAALLVAAFAPLVAACGYRPVYSSASADPAGPFAIVGGPARVPSAIAIVAAEAGARAELARAGQLASCSPETDPSCASMLVEVLRIEETAEGVAIGPAPPGSPADPLARAVRLTITGRARIRAAHAAPGTFLRDTGDVRATEVISRGEGEAARFPKDRDEVIRFAAKTLGERLARRLLGVPDPGDLDE